MKSKRSSRALLRKKVGKDADRILTTLDKKLKAEAPLAEIEQAVADELLAFMDRQVERMQAGLRRMVNP
jgi:hypothetical protein